jgi:hypothetical protein
MPVLDPPTEHNVRHVIDTTTASALNFCVIIDKYIALKQGTTYSPGLVTKRGTKVVDIMHDYAEQLTRASEMRLAGLKTLDGANRAKTDERTIQDSQKIVEGLNQTIKFFSDRIEKTIAHKYPDNMDSLALDALTENMAPTEGLVRAHENLTSYIASRITGFAAAAG